MHHLPERDAQEIGEVLGHLNDVSSDFGPGEILRGLARRIPLPQYHRHAVRPASPLRPPKSGNLTLSEQRRTFLDLFTVLRVPLQESS
jgi:hypothetical protein